MIYTVDGGEIFEMTAQRDAEGPVGFWTNAPPAMKRESAEAFCRFVVRIATNPNEWSSLLCLAAKVARICPDVALGLRAVARSATKQHAMTRDRLKVLGIDERRVES